jgi:hypothetical protein
VKGTAREEFLKLKALNESLLGEPLREVSDFGEVMEALEAGEKGIILLYPWDGRHDGEDYPMLPLVLMRKEGDRIFFCHSLPRREAKAGSFLGGAPGFGPPRRAEDEGIESMDLDTFRKGFDEGAAALLPEARARQE